MIVAQVLNKIYLTIAQSIARFGRFFYVGLLRFNTCGAFVEFSVVVVVNNNCTTKALSFFGEGIV
jgi:hypothetical protein